MNRGHEDDTREQSYKKFIAFISRVGCYCSVAKKWKFLSYIIYRFINFFDLEEQIKIFKKRFFDGPCFIYTIIKSHLRNMYYNWIYGSKAAI